jgi:polysaccharide export outer membrane protein
MDVGMTGFKKKNDLGTVEMAVMAIVMMVVSLAAPGLMFGQTVTKEGGQSKQEPAAEEPTGSGSPVDPKMYKIGPEDVLRIRVWKEPELGGEVAVRPDGMISVDLIGEIQANGLTPEQLTQKLKEEYGKIVINPVVMVSVQAVRSKKYYLTGNLLKTGAVPLVVPTTVLEALSMAGGFTDFADKKNIVILRGDKRLKFNYNDVIKGKNMSQNIYLENGDFVIVN